MYHHYGHSFHSRAVDHAAVFIIATAMLTVAGLIFALPAALALIIALVVVLLVRRR